MRPRPHRKPFRRVHPDRIRVALLRELYYIQPLGRTSATLHERLQPRLRCRIEDVTDQINHLSRQKLLYTIDVSHIVKDLPSFWFITEAGVRHCRQKRLV